MRTLKFSEVENDLRAAIDQVVECNDVAIIAGAGADAVIMSLTYYNALHETLYLLGTPANSAHLIKSIAQYRAGQTEEHSLIDDAEGDADEKPSVLG